MEMVGGLRVRISAGSPARFPVPTVPPPAADRSNRPTSRAPARQVPRDGSGRCSPTWVVVTSHGTTAYVACNAGNQIVEVDLDAWRVRRRLPAEGKPYNLTLTNDGARLVATLKGKGAVGVWDLTTGALLGEIPTTRKVTHGVIATPDNRYAFVSVEGIGGEPGTVDAIDLGRLERVASIDIGKQAGGISFWKTIE